MDQTQHALLAYLLSDSSRLLRSNFDYEAKDLGLTRSQWRTIVYINRQPGISPSQLAETLDIQRAPMGNQVDKLCNSGLLVKTPHPNDKRAWQLHVTDKALALLPPMRKRYKALFATATEGISQHQLDMLETTLSQIKKNLLNNKPSPRRSNKNDR